MKGVIMIFYCTINTGIGMKNKGISTCDRDHYGATNKLKGLQQQMKPEHEQYTYFLLIMMIVYRMHVIEGIQTIRIHEYR